MTRVRPFLRLINYLFPRCYDNISDSKALQSLSLAAQAQLTTYHIPHTALSQATVRLDPRGHRSQYIILNSRTRGTQEQMVESGSIRVVLQD